MATKTIAVDATVYERLAEARHSGESFSKAISRLLDAVGRAHSGADVLAGLDRLSALSQGDAERFLAVVAEGRDTETWPTP